MKSFVFLSFLLLVIRGNLSLDPAVDVDVEKLHDLIRKNGGEVKYTVRKLCPTCLRGVYASEDIPEGNVIVKVPFKLALKVTDHEKEYAAARAYDLIVKMHKDESFNQTYETFFATQPPLQHMLIAETMDEEELDMLQSPGLSDWAVGMRNISREVFEGDFSISGKQLFNTTLNEAITPATIDFDSFLWVLGLMESREFSFDVRDALEVFLMPSIDMLNDCLPGKCNAYRSGDDEFAYGHALKDIKPGDEIVWEYQSNVTHRPDICFAVYGFTKVSDPPLLAAQDLPNFSWSSMFQYSSEDDEDAMPQGEEPVDEEIRRCRGILDSMPTSVEEDEELLRNGTYSGDWRKQEIIKFRIARKAALHHRIDRLSETRSEL